MLTQEKSWWFGVPWSHHISNSVVLLQTIAHMSLFINRLLQLLFRCMACWPDIAGPYGILKLQKSRIFSSWCAAKTGCLGMLSFKDIWSNGALTCGYFVSQLIFMIKYTQNLFFPPEWIFVIRDLYEHTYRQLKFSICIQPKLKRFVCSQTWKKINQNTY